MAGPEPERRRKLWHPRRQDLLALLGAGMCASQAVITFTGRSADPTITGAGLALMIGVPIFARVDEARGNGHTQDR